MPKNLHRQTVIQQGVISSVENHGSIVLVLIRTEKGWATPVPFDHRCFQHLLDGEGCTASDLVGRAARYDGTALTFDE